MAAGREPESPSPPWSRVGRPEPLALQLRECRVKWPLPHLPHGNALICVSENGRCSPILALTSGFTGNQNWLKLWNMILCPLIPLSIVTIRLPFVAWRVHPKGRAPYNPHSPQPAACTSSRLHLARVFSGFPVVGRLRKPSPQIRFHLASAQASASPRQGPACVAWVWFWFQIQMKTTSALPGYLIFLLWGAAPFWHRHSDGHFLSSWSLLLGPFALAGHRATPTPSLIQMSSPDGLHPKRALGSVHWVS